MDWLGSDLDAVISLAGVLLRLSLAMLLAASVGWEREVQHKAAGLRTHILVALGSAAFTITALDMHLLGGVPGDGRSDPSRIVQGVVQALGFLGAGQVIQARGAIRGLTTAAGIWVVGAVGVASGAGLYALAVVVTIFALLVLRVLGSMERRPD